METALCALEVRIHGRPAREYYHNGEIWIEGRKGSEFTLRLSNRTGQQILMVPSIDGLSVMDGEEASFDDRGYIVPAYGYMDVPGWRISDNDVAKFRFHKSGKSYASKTGKPQNVGVIGCAVFQEKLAWTITHTGQYQGPVKSYVHGEGGQGILRGMNVNCNAVQSGSSAQMDSYVVQDSAFVGAAPQAPSLGTEFGKKATHKVQRVTFERATSKPAEVITIRYGDREELRQRGVDLAQKPKVVGPPTAFPAEDGCKPPSGWSG
jgi:hypothetical protein